MQSGTSAVTAFVQQGSQIAGAFGPVGAVVGAAGAVIAGLVTYLSRSSEEAASAADELRKLTESTDQYKNSLESVAPLQKAFLQNLADSQREAEAAGGYFESLLGSLNRTFTELRASRDTGRSNAYEEGIQRLIRGRPREDRAIDEFRFRRVTANVAEFEAKPPYESSAEYKTAQTEAKKLNDERERAAKTAAREAEQRAKLIRQLEQQAEATRRLAGATGEGTYATKLSEIENENQRRILQASQTLTGKQLEQAKALSNEIARLERQRASVETALPTGKSTDMNSLRRQAEQEGYDQSGNLLPIDKNKATEQTERFAEQQYRVLLQPWQDLASTVSGIMSDLYADILTGAENLDFGSIASSFSESITSAMSGALGSLTALPLNSAIASIGTQLAANPGQGFSGALLNFGKQNPGLVAGAGGVLAGQLIGQATGLNSQYSALTGTVGAGAGFLLGNMLLPGVGGPLGALAGGALGSLAGGLFGGENNLGNDRSAQTYSTGKGEIVYSDSSFSQGNRNITSGIIGEIQTIQEALGDLGATFGSFNLRIEAGNKSGITVNGKKYDTAEDALRGAIEELLTSRTGGLNATQQTILANTKGGTAAEIGQDLAFGQTYDRLIQGGNQFDIALKDLHETMNNAGIEAAKLGLSVEALSQAHAREAQEIERQRSQATRGVSEQIAAARGDTSLGTQLHILETQMRELAKAAADLGIPLEQVTDAHQRAAQELARVYEQNQRSVLGQIAAARGDNSLGVQLFNLETQMRELAKSAMDLGLPLELVTQAHEEAARRIIESYDKMIADLRKQAANVDQQIVQANRNAFGAVDQFLDPIKQALGPFGIGQGIYSPAATAQGGIEEFRKVLERAQGGDTQALSSIVGIGQQTLQAARAYGASGSEFQAIFREVNKGLLETQGQLEERRLQLQQQGLDYQRETLDEIVRLRVEQVNELKELREQLRRDLALATERRAA